MPSHHTALLAGYAAALAAWWLFARPRAGLWPAPEAPAPAKPWRELSLAALAVVGVLAIGQAYQSGVRLPARGWWAPATEAINQLFIFAPVLLLLVLRHQPLSSAWVARERWWARVAVGIILSVVAVAEFTLARSGAEPAWRVW